MLSDPLKLDPTSAASWPVYADAVDLARYPIHRLDSLDGQALIEKSRQELSSNGICVLAGFITPTAVSAMIDVASALRGKSWASEQTHTAYFEQPDESVPAAHPRAYRVRSAKHGIAYDYIPVDAPLRCLYESDDLTRFIASVLDKPVLYRGADPLDALQITFFDPGEELGWHFDRSEFSVTVMYQPAEEGGNFEYVPGLRTDDDERYEDVQEVLQGGRSRVVDTGRGTPGTLAFFHGHCAMHRVTPVKGKTSRINSVLTYGENKNMRLNALTSELFYGRTSAA